MKTYLAIFLSIVGTFLATQIYSNLNEDASIAECESLLKEVGSQLDQVKKEYGTYKSGLSSVKYQKIEKCRIVEKDQGFGELEPKFTDNEYTIYFYIPGSKRSFGKIETGNLHYIQ